MMKKEMQILTRELTQLLLTRLAEAGQRTCNTGLDRRQAKEILLRSALNTLNDMAGYWNIQLIADFSPTKSASDQVQQQGFFDA